MSNNPHHLKAQQGSIDLFHITPESAGWRYLSFRVVSLKPGESFAHQTDGNEVALVPLKGQGQVRVAGEAFDLSRANLFKELPHVLYVPPRQTISVTAANDFEFALGGAPAEGKYPTRLFKPSEMRQEIRGAGAARRQVNHILAYPLPAERLILYDVYVPGGMWAGYPPHCHDGYCGSPYLEEVYYYRINPANGFAIHRNYRQDTDFDEVFTVRNGDVVLVTQGFHPVATAPGSNVYFLNYLAGDLVDEQRRTPPYDDPAYVAIKENWEKDILQLPIK